MDNKIFNVNGSGEEDLADVLRIAFKQEGRKTTAKGYVIDKELGFVLCWYVPSADKTISKFPVPLSAKLVAPVVFQWLNSEEAKTIQLSKWDEDFHHDGSNTLGWRVYCEDWGHVGPYNGSIVAIKPAHMWHGK